MHELVEVALVAVCRLFLVDEFEIVLVKLLEEIVPGNLLQFRIVMVGSFREFKTQNPGLSALLGSCNFRRNCSPALGPFPYLVVIFCSS